MGMYGWLVCEDDRIRFWLGKAYRLGDRRVGVFQRGDGPNAAKPELTRALWKFLADHAGHTLRVLTDDDPAYDELEDFVEVGGDTIHDIPFSTYLQDWPG